MENELARILLVDDDTDIQVIVKMSLERVGGYSVRVCGSGEEALREAPVMKPDLIMLDVMMPGMDGPETLKALRQIPETAEIPVVFLTAKGITQDIGKFSKWGVIDTILKPFDPMTLASTLRDIWNSR